MPRRLISPERPLAALDVTTIPIEQSHLQWRLTNPKHRVLPPFKHQVFLSWSQTEAAVTTWKMLVKYWDELWCPGSDDLAVFDESLSWALFLWHEGEAFFASRLPPTARPAT